MGGHRSDISRDVLPRQRNACVDNIKDILGRLRTNPELGAAAEAARNADINITYQLLVTMFMLPESPMLYPTILILRKDGGGVEDTDGPFMILVKTCFHEALRDPADLHAWYIQVPRVGWRGTALILRLNEVFNDFQRGIL